MQSGRKPPGTAVHCDVLEHAVFVLAGFLRAANVKVQVVRHKQIELAVAVVIDPSAARAPTGAICSHAGFFGDIRESAVPIVVIENVFAPVGDEQIVKAVVIVIADADAARPAGSMQPRLGGHVGECAVAVVLV